MGFTSRVLMIHLLLRNNKNTARIRRHGQCSRVNRNERRDTVMNTTQGIISRVDSNPRHHPNRQEPNDVGKSRHLSRTVVNVNSGNLGSQGRPI